MGAGRINLNSSFRLLRCCDINEELVYLAGALRDEMMIIRLVFRLYSLYLSAQLPLPPELAGGYHKGWSLRLNWSQRRESYRGRQQDDGQADDLA